MVLRFVAGLPKAYDTVATMIQQLDPLPNFYHARSKLLLEESRQAQKNEPAPSAMVIPPPPSNIPPTQNFDFPKSSNTPHSPVSRSHNNNRGRSCGRGQNNWRGGRSGRGRARHYT